MKTLPIFLTLTIAFGLFPRGAFAQEEPIRIPPPPVPPSETPAPATGAEGERQLILPPTPPSSETPAPMPQKPPPFPDEKVEPKPATKTNPAPADPKKYVIQSGDNPWLIAKEHGISLQELLKINNIKDPRKLNIGDVLILPAGAKPQSEPAGTSGEKQTGIEPRETTPEIAGPAAGDDWELHTIQRGDNPWTIAKRLKVDHQKILELNEGLDFRNLKIGQKIKVPKKR